ncbi:ATP-binding protein [Streptomyces sp. NPDC091272]|uniref:ATP-binding protein n=1 Tax=Streptomyces sp. NPDC091272 TaxID=3365981 RepID=UPI0038182EB9
MPRTAPAQRPAPEDAFQLAAEECGDQTASTRARALITELLHRCARTPNTARVRGDAHLAATELISNALRHGGGLTGFRAQLNPEATQLSLQVEDTSSALPQLASPADPATPGGRGWAIVKELATACTVALLPAGKRITVTLAV